MKDVFVCVYVKHNKCIIPIVVSHCYSLPFHNLPTNAHKKTPKMRLAVLLFSFYYYNGLGEFIRQSCVCAILWLCSCFSVVFVVTFLSYQLSGLLLSNRIQCWRENLSTRRLFVTHWSYCSLTIILFSLFSILIDAMFMVCIVCVVAVEPYSAWIRIIRVSMYLYVYECVGLLI